MNWTRPKTACVFGALALAVVSWSPCASAQSNASTVAEELFKQGRAALEAKDYPTACKKLGESNRLERAVGTLISLAQCEEAQSHFASARSHWQEAADLADALQDRLQRAAAAREKVAELDKKVARLTIRVAPSAPPDTAVTTDDVALQAAALGTALPVDPGPHVLVVMAKGYEARKYEITLTEGSTQEQVVEPGAALPPPPVEPVPAPVVDPKPIAENDSSGSLRIGAYVAGGVGVVGLGLGTIFGLSASSNWSSAKDACSSTDNCKNRSGAEADKDSASSAANVSTVAFIVGGAALATGVVLFVVSRPKSSTAVRISPSFGGLSASGTF